MSRIKRYIPIIIAVFIMLTFFGCSDAVSDIIEGIDDSEVQDKTETMLDAIIENDFKTAYSLAKDIFSEDEFRVTFDGMHQLLSDVEDYELEALSFQTKTVFGNGTVTSVEYKMITDSGNFVIQAEESSEYEGLSYFHIVDEEHSSLYYTGTIGHMEGANILQWAVLAFWIASVIFVIIMLIDCCRRDVKNKAIWIVAILFGAISLTASLTDSNFNFGFNIGFMLSPGALVLYGDGAADLKLVIPIGAVIYLLIRKSITIKPATAFAPPFAVQSKVTPDGLQQSEQISNEEAHKNDISEEESRDPARTDGTSDESEEQINNDFWVE